MSVKRHLTLGFALALVVAAPAGSALAAPPSTPPGQEKKAEEAVPAPAAQQPAQQQPADAGKNAAPGQEKKAEQAAAAGAATAKPAAPAASTAGAEKTTGINSTSKGVKPSNSTEKHTACWTGGAMPSPTCTPAAGRQASPSGDSSKRYGNGTTAAQIAVSRGAPASTEIRGPGNSQPHKVCGKNGNWVDVHAVKSYVGVCTSSTSLPVTTMSAPSVTCPTSGTTLALVSHKSDKHVWTKANVGQGHLKHGDHVEVTMQLASGESCTAVIRTTSTSVTTTTATTATVTQTLSEVRRVVEQALGTSVVSTSTSASEARGTTGSAAGAAAGGVAGAQATQASRGAAGAAGVLGALDTIGGAAGGTLPFTGFPLWLALLLGVVLLAAGALLRRRSEATARELA